MMRWGTKDEIHPAAEWYDYTCVLLKPLPVFKLEGLIEYKHPAQYLSQEMFKSQVSALSLEADPRGLYITS